MSSCEAPVGSCRPGPRSYVGEPADALEDGEVQATRDRDLGQLEPDVAGVADHLRADLDQPVPQGGQRPVKPS